MSKIVHSFVKFSLSMGICLVWVSSCVNHDASAKDPLNKKTTKIKQEASWRYLFDEKLSNFETWLGVPHASVKGLPKGTYQSADVKKGQPFGLNRDPLNVFSTAYIDDTLEVKVSGEIFGGINTRESFENYHLKLQFKWGFKRWPPRALKRRDSGLLYHCYGEHGAFWQTWKACMEYQIQEFDIGDYIGLAGPTAKFYGYELDKKSKHNKHDMGSVYFDPRVDSVLDTDAYTNALVENDEPLGNWNQLDLYVLGDEAVHVVNGELAFFAQDIRDANNKPLTKGQIQLQSEAAEVYFKNMKIRQIEAFPTAIESQLRRIE